MITSFDGINLYSKNPAALAAFYSEVLGIPVPFEGYGEHDGAKLPSNVPSRGLSSGMPPSGRT